MWIAESGNVMDFNLQSVGSWMPSKACELSNVEREFHLYVNRRTSMF